MHRLVLVLLFLGAPALADSINILTIGTFTYLGPNSQGQPMVKIELNTNGVTAVPFEDRVGTLAGSIGGETINIPTTAAFTEILAPSVGSCPCTFLSFGIVLSTDLFPTVTFLLANGQLFTAFDFNNSTILPLPGQSFIQAGQSVPVTLTAVPEPATVFLVGSGLVGWLLRRGLSIDI